MHLKIEARRKLVNRKAVWKGNQLKFIVSTSVRKTRARKSERTEIPKTFVLRTLKFVGMANERSPITLFTAFLRSRRLFGTRSPFQKRLTPQHFSGYWKFYDLNISKGSNLTWLPFLVGLDSCQGNTTSFRVEIITTESGVSRWIEMWKLNCENFIWGIKQVLGNKILLSWVKAK